MELGAVNNDGRKRNVLLSEDESEARLRKEPPPSAPKYTVHTDMNYDFRAHRSTVHKKTNVLESIGHLVKGCLGGGIMGVHEAYMKAGLWTGLVFTILFGLYITYCVYLLVHSAQILCRKLHVPDMSFPDVAEASMAVGPFPKLRPYAKWFRYCVDFVIMLDLFGSCCVYMIIIAKTIKQVLEEFGYVEEGGINVLRLYVAGILIPVLLLGMITSLKYLAPFSLLADFFILVCVVSTVVYALRVAPPISERPVFKDFMGFFEFCGVVVFSMEGVGVSLPIENNMDEPHKFHIVLIGGMTVVCSFVIIVGFFGYWGFGDDCISPVTLNFPVEIYPTMLKLLMAFMIYITYAINFWAPFNLAWFYIQKKYDPSKHWFWERVYRAIIITVICIIAVIFPNIGNLMGLLGSFCLSNMGFIFPAMIETLIVWDNPGLGPMKWILHKNILICILGILLLISGTYSNARGLLENI